MITHRTYTPLHWAALPILVCSKRPKLFSVRFTLASLLCILTSFVSSSLLLAETQDLPQELPKPIHKTTPPLFQEWNFNKDQVGQSPATFSEMAGGNDSHGSWQVQVDSSAPSSPHAVIQKNDCGNSSCYQLLLAEGTNVQYVDLSVRMKMMMGSPTGKGGLVFGAKDEKNFYAVVVTPDSNTLETFLIQDGQLTSLGRVSVTPKQIEWHFLRIQRNTILSQELIEVFFDDHLIFSLSDSSIGPGKVGLVTFGEGVFAFDNLRAMELLASRPLSRPPAY